MPPEPDLAFFSSRAPHFILVQQKRTDDGRLLVTKIDDPASTRSAMVIGGSSEAAHNASVAAAQKVQDKLNALPITHFSSASIARLLSHLKLTSPPLGSPNS